MLAHIVHVVGARPNFVKAAAVTRSLAGRRISQSLVHTGQHHDEALSGTIFADLKLAQPDVTLDAGWGAREGRLARLLGPIEDTLQRLRPALVVVYGDVDSTLAAALSAADLGMPAAHVEAGLRSFDLTMPEELNRRITDALSTILFATTPEAVDNLLAEGIPADRIHHVGNPMVDTLRANLHRLEPEAVAYRLGIARPYGVATMHRPANVDEPSDASRTVVALAAAAAHLPIVLALHPRGRAALEDAGLAAISGLTIAPPLGYIDFLSLVRGAAIVLTDSGGVQEETTVLGIPCLTMRPSTERPITITAGTNRLVRPDEVGDAVAMALASVPAAIESPALWDGHAADRIAAVIEDWLAGSRIP